MQNCLFSPLYNCHEYSQRFMLGEGPGRRKVKIEAWGVIIASEWLGCP